MVSNFLIKLIVFLLPTQLGLHFWPSFSRVASIKIDYLSPTLYFVDILLLILISLNLKLLFRYLKKNIKPLFLFVLFIIFNTIFSVSPVNSLFWWIRTFLYLLTFIIFRQRHLQWEQIKKPLLYSTVIIVLIEIAQLLLQSSIGGPLYFLGERAYSSITPGIGRFNLFGREVLRPISTFSHSNSLAGYLLIVFYLFSKDISNSWYKVIPFIGILLSFSKNSIIALAFVLFDFKPGIIIYLSVLLTLIQLFLQNTLSSWKPLSDRLFYFVYLKKIITQNIFTGTGLGGFITSLGTKLPGSYLIPSKLQPLHNLPILIMTELGIIGTIVASVVLIKNKIYKYLSNPLALGLIALVLFTGAFDHYTWTLPQNKLIFLLALSIML